MQQISIIQSGGHRVAEKFYNEQYSNQGEETDSSQKNEAPSLEGPSVVADGLKVLKEVSHRCKT